SELGVNAQGLEPDELAAVFAGNVMPPGAEPIAMAYAGHQFGSFVPERRMRSEFRPHGRWPPSRPANLSIATVRCREPCSPASHPAISVSEPSNISRRAA